MFWGSNLEKANYKNLRFILTSVKRFVPVKIRIWQFSGILIVTKLSTAESLIAIEIEATVGLVKEGSIFYFRAIW